jgi:hypothetical protein
MVTEWEVDGAGRANPAPAGASGKGSRRQTILRSTDRVLVSTEGARTDWLFERNPVDHRRAIGYLVDHKRRRVLVHEESVLHATQQIRGWLDVISLRVDPAQVISLPSTGETQSAFGITFTRHARRTPVNADGFVEVWWNAEYLLPLASTFRQGARTITTRIESIETAVADDRLTPPSRQFPSYQMLDIADASDQH